MGKGNRTRNDKYQDAYDMSGSGAAVKSAKAPKKDRTSTIVLVTIIALIVVSLLLVVFADTGIKDRHTIIVSSENYEVTGTMLPYYENLAYSNMFNQYFQLYYSYVYPNNISSAYTAAQNQMANYTLDSFFDSALNSAKEILVLCEAAKANGLALDDEDKKSIEETIDSFEGQYTANFGTGVKEKDIRKAIELEVLAGKYYDKFHEDEEAKVTEEDIKKYIEENKADFYAAHYLKYTITLKVKDYADDSDAFSAAKDLANKYLALLEAAKTEKDFKNQVIRYIVDRDFKNVFDKNVSKDIKPTDEETVSNLKTEVINDLIAVLVEEKEAEKLGSDATELEKAMDKVLSTLKTTCTTAINGLSGEQAYVAEPEADEIKWLVNPESVALSTKLVTDKESDGEEYSRTIYMLTEPLHLEDEETVNVGHILTKIETGDKVDKDKADADAKKKAEEILAAYLAGEKTKDAFEKLGKEKTEDSNVFYENVAKDQMVEEFDEWIFSEDRKEIGETAIVKTEYGYHVMYWNGKGENTSITAAKTGIVDDLYTEFVKKGSESLKVNEKYVAKHTTETTASTESADK